MAELTDHEMLLGIWEDMREVKESLMGFRKVLYGNGNVGLVARHDSLQTEFSHFQRIFVWLGGVLGVILMGFLWSILTGQVTIQFR